METELSGVGLGGIRRSRMFIRRRLIVPLVRRTASVTKFRIETWTRVLNGKEID